MNDIEWATPTGIVGQTSDKFHWTYERGLLLGDGTFILAAEVKGEVGKETEQELLDLAAKLHRMIDGSNLSKVDIYFGLVKEDA